MQTVNEKFTTFFANRAWKFRQRIKHHVLAEQQDFEASYRHLEDYRGFKDAIDGEFKPLHQGDKIAATWEVAMVHLKGSIPQEWAGKRVVAELDFNAEALLLSTDGLPLQGITNESVFDLEFSRDLFTVSESAKGGEAVEFYLEASTVRPWGTTPKDYPDTEPQDPERYGKGLVEARRFRLRVFDQEMFDLLMDVEVLHDLYNHLEDKDVKKAQILHGLNKAIDVYGEARGNAAAAREVLSEYMQMPARASALQTAAVGHAHIDTAWLWPIRETIRKSARTFANQLRLMERYPDYVFGASQPQHYQMVKDEFPELYEEIKAAHKRGQWELQGGMWVEADCNVISGESMIRQFIHGKNFYMDEFGEDVQNLWIPDVFGYSAAMPQIMDKSGVDTFLTQKISWSQWTDFPYSTFNWRGIDGTDILTHFPPANTYNCNMRSSQMNFSGENFKEKHFLPEFISLFGVGDGGGGPREDFIEYAKRQENLDGCPKVKFDSAKNFFKRLHEHKDELSTWHGELYLAYHRGTYTTQAQVKLKNRLLEQRMRELEMLYTMGSMADYPLAAFDDMWKQILVNQFHDIIPGSSINMVYEETNKQYDALLEQCDQLQQQVAAQVLSEDGNALTLFNSLSDTFTGEITLPEGWSGAEGYAAQTEGDNTVIAVEIPAMSFVTITKADNAGALSAGDALVLENDLVRYEFNNDGQMISAYDKEIGRDIMHAEDKGNVFSLYHDRPINYDAWDIDIYYENEFTESATGVSAKHGGNGPVRSNLHFDLKIGSSAIKQHVSLTPGSKRLDFYTSVDWNEKHQVLRVAFPVDVHVEQACFDIQYGYTNRPTHRNTAWDISRFEVCAHKWADMSDAGYGVSLLNNCKYGYKLHNNVIDLCVLRSPTWPDPDADIGVHELRYAFLPHTNTVIQSDVQREAFNLNQTPVVFNGFAQADNQLPATLNSEDIHLAALKKAEKEDCWIVRAVEMKGKHSKAELQIPNNATLHLCGMMEWDEGDAIAHDGSVTLQLKPFEILTYKLKA